MRITWRLENLKTVLEATCEDGLGTQWNLGIIKVHPRSAMRVLQVSLVSGLPIKDHLTASMPAEPLRIRVMEVLHVALQIVFAGACFLNALLKTESTGE
jgi:hypothetical protein